MKRIPLTEAQPGMVLARYILSGTGQILLAPDVVLTREYLRKLAGLSITYVYVKNADHPDIVAPEYLSVQTQQKALAILDQTFGKLARGETFAADAVDSVATDIVEEVLHQPVPLIHLSGIMTHDDTTMAHSLNCSIYSAILARLAGFSFAQIKEVAAGALLHDVGKVLVDKAILNKPGRLTAEEYASVKLHCEMGFNSLITKRWEISSLVAHMAWQHHERMDGSGYPRGLKGMEILPYARMLAIADVYEAISASRPYRGPMPPEDIYQTIASNLGFHLDLEFGELFLSKLAIYLPGMDVMLNTGEKAVVVSVPVDSPLRPVIRLTAHPDGSPYKPYKEIDLADHPRIRISSTKSAAQ